MTPGLYSGITCLLISLVGASAVAATPAEDPSRGERIYQRCLACHALAYHRVGPLHCGVIGRRAGSAPGYDYSEAMRESSIIWTSSSLDAFLAAPTVYVKGTTMSYAGIEDARDRRDLIAFLAAASGDPERCPATTAGEQ